MSERSHPLPTRPAARPALRTVLLAVGASLALAASAQVQVPMQPVPMTMQSLVVLLIGVAGGWRFGLATTLLYLAEGAAGLPVFAGFRAGVPVLLGPTGGYLIGFAPAAACAGWLAARGWTRGPVRSAGLLALGHAVIFAFGVPVLALGLGWGAAVAAGLLPFLLGTAVKVALGAALIGAAGPARRSPA